MEMDLPLRGVRVVDLCRLIGGATTTLKLADLGADVVKVEEPGRGDYLRDIPPFVDGRSLPNDLLNRGKRSVEIDLKTEAGRKTLDGLVAVADVVVEVSRPGRLQELGIDFDRWKEHRPSLTICSITGFGQTGELASLPAHGMNIDAMAGSMAVELRADGRETIGTPVSLGLELGALNAVVAILASVLEARQTGTGRIIDVSCWDAAVSLNRLEIAHKSATGESALTPKDLGAFYDLYRTSDDQLILFCAIEEKFWKSFCLAAGRPDLRSVWQSESEVDYGTDPALRGALDKVFSAHTAGYWQSLFMEHGIPGCQVMDPADVLQVRHFEDRSMVENEATSHTVLLADPIRFADDGTRPGQRRTPAPSLGEHTAQVLQEWGVALTE